MDTAPFSNWDDAAELFPWGGGSFGVWLFVILAILIFIGMIVRAVQHENDCMSHLVDDVHRAEANGEVAEPEKAVAAAAGS